jgi:hypothetical protein
MLSFCAILLVFSLKRLCRITTADKCFIFFGLNEKPRKRICVVFRLTVPMFGRVIFALREWLPARLPSVHGPYLLAAQQHPFDSILRILHAFRSVSERALEHNP